MRARAFPPLWIQRIITPTYPDWDTSALSSWQLVTFQIQSRQCLSAPQWTGIAQTELHRLVGGPVDDQRGLVFVEEELQREDVAYAVVPMHQMPLEKPFREGCMGAAVSERTSPRRGWLAR